MALIWMHACWRHSLQAAAFFAYACAAGKGSTFIKWCGLLVNTATLELQGDYTRYCTAPRSARQQQTAVPASASAVTPCLFSFRCTCMPVSARVAVLPLCLC